MDEVALLRPKLARLKLSGMLDRLVHRAVKIVIEGKSYRMDSFVRRSRDLPEPPTELR